MPLRAPFLVVNKIAPLDYLESEIETGGPGWGF